MSIRRQNNVQTTLRNSISNENKRKYKLICRSTNGKEVLKTLINIYNKYITIESLE